MQPSLVARGEPLNFMDIERPTLDSLKRLGRTKAMRALDSVRRHTVSESEGEELGANGRLDIQVRGTVGL